MLGGGGHAARGRECRWVGWESGGMQPLGASTLFESSLGEAAGVAESMRKQRPPAAMSAANGDSRATRPLSLALCVLFSLACPAK